MARILEEHEVDQERFLYGPTPSVEEAPEIDFRRYTLIVAGAGTKPTGGFTISINNVFEGSDFIRVSVIETKPGHNCAGTTISTRPFVGASIPTTIKRVIFDIATARDSPVAGPSLWPRCRQPQETTPSPRIQELEGNAVNDWNAEPGEQTPANPTRLSSQ
jgi:protease stability complex PrcB-like protein